MKWKPLLVTALVLSPVSTGAAAQTPQPEPKSKSTAMMYSLGGTLLPAAVAIPIWARGEEFEETGNIAATTLFSAGILFGPGIGHIYGHNGRRFWRGALLRGVGAATVVLGATEVEFFGTDSENALPFLLILAGTATVGVSMIHDIATVGGSVDRYNRRHGSPNISVSLLQSAHSRVTGLRLSVRF